MMLQQALVQEIQNFYSEQTPILITEFVLLMDNKTYQNTQAFLFLDHIVLKLTTRKDLPHLKIAFNFDLLFDLQRFDDEKSNMAKLGHPHTLRLQRYNQSLSLKNANAPEDLLKWRDLLAKKLNQRSFHELFKPVKRVGKGSFASVYLVVKYENGREYAVKAFSKQATFSLEKGKQSLINQIQIMRKLNHKNLMKLYEIYESQNSIYICVELLSGGQLYEKIKNKYKFSMEEIRTVMKGILEGLSAMHLKNIMHRDLKPQNILFRKQDDFDCVIADFGLSTQVDLPEYLFLRCGTPGYVAPQVVNLKELNAKYTTACDIFGAGIILHLLLMRKSPFPGKQYNEVLSQNRACKFNFQAAEYKILPQQALDLLRKMLQKDPSKRITALQALRHDFFRIGIKRSTEPIKSQLSSLSNIQQRQPLINLQDNNQNVMQCESPLMITKNQARKQGARLKKDSCLKFKMKENVAMGRAQDGAETIQQIDSPALLSKRGQKVNESRFRRQLRNENG